MLSDSQLAGVHFFLLILNFHAPFSLLAGEVLPHDSFCRGIRGDELACIALIICVTQQYLYSSWISRFEMHYLAALVFSRWNRFSNRIIFRCEWYTLGCIIFRISLLEQSHSMPTSIMSANSFLKPSLTQFLRRNRNQSVERIPPFACVRWRQSGTNESFKNYVITNKERIKGQKMLRFFSLSYLTTLQVP